MNGKLQDRVTLVTGAAEGIGLAIARMFAREGAIVEMGDLQQEKAEGAATEIRSLGGQATARHCDVGSTKEVSEWVDAIMGMHGRIDILVNNAGIAVSGRVTEMPDEDWDRLINVNLGGVFRTIRSVLPHMLTAGKGVVVNLASTQGHRGIPDWTAYASTKGGIIAMTRQLAAQFGPDGIRFNSISPGATDTPMNTRLAGGNREAFLEAERGNHALARAGRAEEVAAAALFLSSDEASNITGHDLVVDGGMCALPGRLPAGKVPA